MSDIGIGTIARCSRGRIGVITGQRELPWGLSWVGVGLDNGTQWASRNPTPLTEAEIAELGDRAPTSLDELTAEAQRLGMYDPPRQPDGGRPT